MYTRDCQRQVFFQAEDGIRDRSPSRGLGDVYKRQDDDIALTMKLLGNSSFSDEKIIAGENSAPGVISLITSCVDIAVKKKLKLNSKSNILVIGCEGDTDKEMYQKLINQ